MSEDDPVRPEDVPLAKTHQEQAPEDEADEAAPDEPRPGGVLNYATERYAPLVTIATYNVPGEAHVAAVMLEGRGFSPVVLDNLTATLGPFSSGFSPVQLQVPEPEAEYAAKLIAEYQEQKAARTRPSCPECGSLKVTHPYMGPVQIVVALLLLCIPFFLHGSNWVCQSCGHRWYARPVEPEEEDEEDGNERGEGEEPDARL